VVDLDRFIIPDPLPVLRGPNFDIEVANKNTVATSYQTYSDIVGSYQSLSSASYYQILSFSTSQSIDINVDYTEFSNFTRFSKAEKRVTNFYTKVSEIQDLRNFILAQTPNVTTTSSLATEIASASSSIADIIANFDGYEYFLYFESSSYTWPKTSPVKPFLLASTGSAAVQTWITSSIATASLYDSENLDNLENTIPGFIREDANNEQYLTFINMVGHYFDNVWIYLKSITDLFQANNNLEQGVSKDLVYHALRSLGVKVYNSKGDEDLDKYIVGNNTGSVDDFTNLSNEFLNNIPRQDLLAETYKRIYHNIPLLFKAKGTRSGLDYVTNLFGVTESILRIKEFGGMLRTDYLNGYTTDKIRIVNNDITGSVLSPMLSLEVDYNDGQYRNIDQHRVDISFSPQNQIDNVISGSYASSGFDIDEHIGDPRLYASSSYPSLVATASLNFSSSFPHTFDYAGFVRLIKFFDNSLFKTLKDYVPARDAITTGVSIRSHLLERPKLKGLGMSYDSSSVYDAEYEAPEISEDKDYFYEHISGSKAPFYTGELTGSVHDVYQYFENTNPNPYTMGVTSSFQRGITGFPNTTGSFTFADRNLFEHTDFNILFHNVSESRRSTTRETIQNVPTGAITFAFYSSGINQALGYYNRFGKQTYTLSGPVSYSFFYATGKDQTFFDVPLGISLEALIRHEDAWAQDASQLQDSYQSLSGHQNSRYNGSKVTSLDYNNHTTSSSAYVGDKSFGKTAAIDKYVLKLGLFSEVNENRYLIKRNNVALKYLVDKDGSLTELNQRNKHWEEVQNTFVIGDNLVVSLFDNQKYSNQKNTDGSKSIYDSGYSYYPMLYWANETKLYFQYSGQSIAKLFRAANLRTDRSLTTSGYGLSASGSRKVVYEIFDNDNTPSYPTYDDSNLYSTGSSGSAQYPKYTVPENGEYVFAANFYVNTFFSSTGQSGSYTFEMRKNGSVIATQTIPLTSSANLTVDNSMPYFSLHNPSYGTLAFSSTPIITSIAYTYLDVNGNSQTLPAGSTIYQLNGLYGAPFCPIGSTNPSVAQGNPTFITSGSAYTLVDPLNSANYSPGIINCDLDADPNSPSTLNLTNYNVFNTSINNMFSINTDVNFSQVAFFQVQSNLDMFNTGDVVEFRFIQDSISPSATSYLGQGSLEVQLQANYNGLSPFATSSAAPFISGSVSPDELVLNESVSGFVDYLFLPDGSASGSVSSSLYSEYGDVDYSFSPKNGDMIIIKYHGVTYEHKITGYSISGSKAVIGVSPDLANSLSTTFLPAHVERVLLLTKQKDEQNVILRFQKKEGHTSYGLIIPHNIHPDVLANIDTITSEIKTKLIEAGQVSGSF
jgi:hypothetical protein